MIYWLRHRWKRVVLGAFALALITAVGIAVWIHQRIDGCLPVLDGTLVISGVESDVTIERDGQGVPTVTAQSRSDAAFSLGFLHAQDRFFQMDLLRRQSAGKLSEIFGGALFAVDDAFRRHRFQRLASTVVNRLTAQRRELLEAYARGVNGGLDQLQASPLEYLVLRVDPAPWKIEDSILVMMTMYCDLQDEIGYQEYRLGLLKNALPDAAYQFLVRDGTEWDASLDGGTFDEPEIPSAEVWSLRDVELDLDESLGASQTGSSSGRGSNNWAISGTVTGDGRAILGCDMHLSLAVPAIWYRVVMNTPTVGGEVRRLVGVTLPGLPALIAGSNGSIAWGYTNSYGDFGDVIELRQPSPESREYATADGPRQLETITEIVDIRGGPAREINYDWTEWGPVVFRDEDRRRFVHRWVGHDHEAVNLNLLEFESAVDLEEVLRIANTCGMPQQNFVCVDSQANIGWTVAGRLPDRPGLAPRTPVDWSDGALTWRGYLDPSRSPRIVNPPGGRIWTANARVVSGAGLQALGDGGYALGARARQIRDRLRAKDKFTERELLDIQLDDEALFLKRWQKLLLDLLDRGNVATSAEFKQHVANWGARAAVDSVGYRIVRRFRTRVVESIEKAIATKAGLDGRVRIPQSEGFVWQILRERPVHLLPRGVDSWDSFLAAHAATTEALLTTAQNLDAATWGQHNKARVKHPLSGSLSSLAPWLDMPLVELPGDRWMPRVQTPNFGASVRMVVSPGHEEDGIFHMPGGQSGHPESPFYRAGFEDWTEGRPSPLLPGLATHRLTLKRAALPSE